MLDMLQAHRHGGLRRNAGRLPAALLVLQAHIAAAAVRTATATGAPGWLDTARCPRSSTAVHQLWERTVMVAAMAGRSIHKVFMNVTVALAV